MDFQERLFTLRRQAGLSQEELANLLNVTRQAVQKWEAGTSRPDMDNLVSLSEYFKVSLDHLVTGKEPTPLPQSSQTVINNYYHPWYEYRSKRTLFGLPLVHINMGFGLRVARGIIAIGNISIGVLSIGGLALGLISLGGLALGLLLVLAGVGVGAIALGGLAIGVLAVGGVAFGWFVWGGVAWGAYSVGGVAIASKIAVGGVVSAPLAIGSSAEGAKTILIPPNGLTGADLDAAKAAIDAACQGAPGFVPWLLKLVL